jgi:hypothetical protein
MTDIEREIFNLRFDVLRNALYHTARTQFLDFCSKATNFIIIICGASAIGGLFDIPKWLAAISVVAATFQLVGDFAVLARQHAYFQRRCYELLAQLDSIAADAPEELEEINEKLTLLYGEEPPTMWALNAIAYNEACEIVGKPDGRKPVNTAQSVLRNLYPFNEMKFSTANAKTA